MSRCKLNVKFIKLKILNLMRWIWNYMNKSHQMTKHRKSDRKRRCLVYLKKRRIKFTISTRIYLTNTTSLNLIIMRKKKSIQPILIYLKKSYHKFKNNWRMSQMNTKVKSQDMNNKSNSSNHKSSIFQQNINRNNKHK